MQHVTRALHAHICWGGASLGANVAGPQAAKGFARMPRKRRPPSRARRAPLPALQARSAERYDTRILWRRCRARMTTRSGLPTWGRGDGWPCIRPPPPSTPGTPPARVFSTPPPLLLAQRRRTWCKHPTPLQHLLPSALPSPSTYHAYAFVISPRRRHPLQQTRIADGSSKTAECTCPHKPCCRPAAPAPPHRMHASLAHACNIRWLGDVAACSVRRLAPLLPLLYTTHVCMRRVPLLLPRRWVSQCSRSCSWAAALPGRCREGGRGMWVRGRYRTGRAAGSAAQRW